MAAGCLVASVFTLLVVSEPGYLAAFGADQRDALALFFQEANDDIVLVWNFFFALSLVLTGWLVHRSSFLPRLVGILLALAGVGYFVQSFGEAERRGLVARERSDVDGRAVEVYLTELGEGLAESATARADSLVLPLVAALDDTEKVQFKDLLDKLQLNGLELAR